MYFRLYYISLSSGQVSGLHPTTAGIQIYGREMKASIPTMTSNTTPYGVASGTTYKSGGDYYKAFVPFASNQSGWAAATGETSASIYYQFATPQQLKGKVGFYLVTCQSGGVGKQVNVTVIASNDGNTWTDITDPVTLTMVVYNNNPSPYIIEVNSDDYYTYFGLHINGTMYISGNYQLALTNLNLYNSNYSEYDWDAENPRYYLYDHGCLKDFTYTQTYETSASRLNGVVISRSNSEEYKFTSGPVTSDSTWFFIDKQINMEPYSRVFIEYFSYGGSWPGALGVYANKVSNPTALASVSIPVNSKTATSINVSSINTSNYIAVAIHNDDIYCNELWLE